ncbi:MAG: cupin domain-containing protein [Ktedonobacterales bacterium]
MNKVNIREALASVEEYWLQKIIGVGNGQLFKVARGIDETRWHTHDDQDEVFILYKGHLTMQLRDCDVELYTDDLFIVPKGVEHCPRANGEVEFMIIGLNITSNAAGGKPDEIRRVAHGSGQ